MFEKIIGHEKITRILERSYANNQLPHAFLFIGPEHVGKKTVAQTLMEGLLKGSLKTHPDALCIERLVDKKTGKRKNVITVDQIRELCGALAQSSLAGGYKTVLMAEADRLHPAAANALLKTLEEPKGKTLIILLATNADALPATIASRCLCLQFQPVAKCEIEQALVARHGLSGAEAQTLARLSAGCPGIAVSLVTDGALRAQMQTDAKVFFDLVHDSIPKRLASLASLIPKETEDSEGIFVKKLNAFEISLRDVLLKSIACDEYAVDTEHASAVAQLASTRKSAWALASLAALARARGAMPQGNTLIALEHIFLQ